MSAIQPRTSTVTIYQGDYLDRLRHLERRHEAALDAEESTPQRQGGKSEAAEIAAEHAALKAEAEETALQVVVQAIRRSSWKALVKANPPREGHDGDAQVGVNEDDFKDALVAFVNEKDPEDRTIVSGLSVDDLDRLADVDFDRLYFQAFALNRTPAMPGKAHLVSRANTESDEN